MARNPNLTYILGPDFGVDVVATADPAAPQPAPTPEPTPTGPVTGNYLCSVVTINKDQVELEFTKDPALPADAIYYEPKEVLVTLVPNGTPGLPTTAEQWADNAQGYLQDVTPVSGLPADGGRYTATVPGSRATSGTYFGQVVIGVAERSAAAIPVPDPAPEPAAV